VAIQCMRWFGKGQRGFVVFKSDQFVQRVHVGRLVSVLHVRCIVPFSFGNVGRLAEVLVYLVDTRTLLHLAGRLGGVEGLVDVSCIQHLARTHLTLTLARHAIFISDCPSDCTQLGLIYFAEFGVEPVEYVSVVGILYGVVLPPLEFVFED